MTSNENLSPAVQQRIMKELRTLVQNPGEGIKVIVSDDIRVINADIEGPVGTPFEGGLFRCKLVLGPEFPQAPPKAHFISKIFHPNVSKTGEICVNTLKKDWVSTHGIAHVLLVIRCLLIHPNPESALNEEAGKLLLEKYDDYAQRARLMTQIHAKARKPGTDGKKPLDESKEMKIVNPDSDTTAAMTTQSSSSSNSSNSKGENSDVQMAEGSENAGQSGLADKTNKPIAMADISGSSNSNAPGKGTSSQAGKSKPAAAVNPADKLKLQAKKSLRRL